MGSKNKALHVLLVDVGPSMRDKFARVTEFLQAYIHSQIMYREKDEVALVLYGSNATFNDVYSELEKDNITDQYANIYVMQHLQFPNVELLRKTQGLVAFQGDDDTPSDFIEAVTVGADIINKAERKGSASNLVLVTDMHFAAESPEADFLEGVASQLKNGEVNLQVMDACATEYKRTAAEQQAQDMNMPVLKDLIELGFSGGFDNITDATKSYATSSVASVRPTTISRCDLEIGPSMTVPVWIYKKTVEASLPVLKPYSDSLPEDDPEATHNVIRETTRRSTTNPDAEDLAPEQLIKAYKFGKQRVPVDDMQEDYLKFVAGEKSTKLVGFVKRAQIPRSYFMKDVSVVVPWPAKKDAKDRVGLEEGAAGKAARAVSALAQALAERDACALVRGVWRKGAAIKWGVLTPHLVRGVGDFLLYNDIPYRDDLRMYTFPSFYSASEKLTPQPAQMDAALALVTAMDLTKPALAPPTSTPGLDGFLRPNPCIQRFHAFMRERALDENAKVPPATDFLDIMQEVSDPEAKHAIGAFKAAFVVEVASSTALAEPDKEDEPASKRARTEVPHFAAGATISLDSLAATRVDSITRETPLEDFSQMMKRSDGDGWAARAMDGMRELVKSSLVQSDADNPGIPIDTLLECARVLRGATLERQLPSAFNSLLYDLAAAYTQPLCAQFWGMLESAGLTLISNHEVSSSQVTPDEAKTFLADTANKHRTTQAAAPVAANEPDDFDDME